MNIDPAPIPNVASPNTLPAIDCPDPSIFLSDGHNPQDILAKRPQAKSSNKRRRRPRGRTRAQEDRERAELLQAAILIARGRLGLQGSPFDPNNGNPFRPDNGAFLEVAQDAAVRTTR